MDLIADIGATHTRSALLDARGRIACAQTFDNADFAGPDAVLGQFVTSAGGARLERGALAIAGPVAGDEVAMLNIDWRLNRDELMRALGLSELHLLNDFEALAHGLPALRARDSRRIGGGRALSRATLAVLGPGSGLGVAAAVPHGDGWTAVAGEGGHVSVAALDETEAAIVAEHGDANGHCSAERLLSGPGLVRIHATLARLEGSSGETPTAAEITARAARGDALASETYAVFFSLLGTVAGNLALTVGARGGVFIAGGIVPRVVDALERSDFRERFVAKGRYRAYLDAIETRVITVAEPAFIGLRAVLGYA